MAHEGWIKLESKRPARKMFYVLLSRDDAGLTRSRKGRGQSSTFQIQDSGQGQVSGPSLDEQESGLLKEIKFASILLFFLMLLSDGQRFLLILLIKVM